MPPLSRRHFLLTAAAIAAPPAQPQSYAWQGIASRARRLKQCHALVIYRHGNPLLAERFRGPAIGDTVPIKSVSKTIIAALAGTVVDRGEIPSIDSTLGELIPQLIPAGADPRVASITFSNLLTMQAGLQRTSGRNYGNWVASANWVENALSRPLVAKPGTRMLYSTGSYHVLGAIMTELTGQSLLSLARARLGRPLGIAIPGWTRDPQGRYLGGNEMALTLPAMIQFGELYRNGGRTGKKQVLSQDWVKRSLQPATRSFFTGLFYGYGWFLGTSNSVNYALARGYGGQIICIVPELAMTIAITSDPNQPARSYSYFGDLLRLIEDEMIPLALAEAS